MNRIFIVLLLLTSSLIADVKSTPGQIKFDTQMDNQAEMTLNSTGLGIGTTPSSNLHVNGNAIVTEQVFVGGSSGSSNLNVNGTLGHNFQTVTSSTTLSGNSIVLADTSSGNIVLSLPEASTYEGRKYSIKKTSTLNSLFIRDGGFIDNYSDVTLSVNSMGSLSVISNSGNWHILNLSGNGDLITSDNLVGWWKLNEASGTTANDSSGFGHHGALAASMTFSGNGTAGKIGRSLVFDGVDDKVTISQSEPINSGNNISLSFWIKGPALQSNFANIFHKIDAGTGWSIQAQGTGPTIYVRVDTAASGSGFNQFGFNFGTVLDSTWHHCVITLDGSRGKNYVDGQLYDDTALIYNSGFSGSVDLVIANSDFQGMLDDIRFYNRVLTAEEVYLIYKSH